MARILYTNDMVLDRYVQDLAVIMNTRYPEQLVEEFFICSECSENLIVDSLIGRSEDCQEGALYCTKCTKEMVECDIQDTEEKNKELKEMLARLNATEK